MKKAIYQAAVALLAVSALIFGRPVSFPDKVHTAHGLPLTWGIHQLVTIAGPVDTWSVNIVYLAVDLVLWLGLVILTPIVAERFIPE